MEVTPESPRLLVPVVALGGGRRGAGGQPGAEAHPRAQPHAGAQTDAADGGVPRNPQRRFAQRVGHQKIQLNVNYTLKSTNGPLS